MDRYPEQAVITPSARKHGIKDADIRHALKHHQLTVVTEDPEFTIYVGPSSTAELLEIGVVDDLERQTVIHAMAARLKYLRGQWI